MARILIVEDDIHQQRLYEKALAPDHNVVCLSNGYDALREDWPSFDVAIVDLLMEGMPGDALILRASEHYGEKLPPVILFTASPKFLTHRLHIPATIITKGGASSSVLSELRTAVANAIANHSP